MNPYESPKTITQTSDSFLQEGGIAVQCTSCQHLFNGVPRKSFLGFKKFSCPECKKKFLLPLYTGYRIFYWIVLLCFIGFQVSGQSNGQPSIFTVLMAIAIVYDIYLLIKLRMG
ncbi:MAG TPA: hypothetical protein VNW52_04260 [Burkholderiaceae bacterium]|nr:hypothetical protein [Burkholderiaceae bacterium]